MQEKKTNQNNEMNWKEKRLLQPKKEFVITPYEFEVKLNDSIICQRYIGIPKYNKKARYSIELLYALDEIVSIIDEDLKSKSRVYTWYRYYPEYNDEEFIPKQFKGVGEKSDPFYVNVHGCLDLQGLRKTGETNYIEYEKPKQIYVQHDKPKDVNGVKTYLQENENTLTFSFKIDGQTVISKCWNGDYYPESVRKEIDLTNKRKFEGTDESRMYPDALLTKYMHFDKFDLMPVIGNILTDVCSQQDSYYVTSFDYGDKTYDNCLKEQ